MSSKLTKKKAQKRHDDRLKRAQAQLDDSKNSRGAFHAPGSRNFKKAGR